MKMEEKIVDVDDTLFVKFFGGYPIVRVLSFLMEMRAYDYSKKEIAGYSGIAFSTLNLFWDKIVEKDIVIPTRKIDKAILYSLNRESPLVVALMNFSNKLAMEAIPKQKVVVKH